MSREISLVADPLVVSGVSELCALDGGEAVGAGQ